MNFNFDKQQLINDFKSMPPVLKRLLLHPIPSIRRPKEYSPATMITFFLLMAAISGGVSGLISQSLLHTVFGLLIFPLTTSIAAILVIALVYYVFYFFEGRSIEIRSLITVFTYGSVFFFLFHLLAGLFPIFDILGSILSGLIVMVGLVDYCGLSKFKITRLFLALFAFFLISWTFNQWRSCESQRERTSLKPQTLDELENELRRE